MIQWRYRGGEQVSHKPNPETKFPSPSSWRGLNLAWKHELHAFYQVTVTSSCY